MSPLCYGAPPRASAGGILHAPREAAAIQRAGLTSALPRRGFLAGLLCALGGAALLRPPSARAAVARGSERPARSAGRIAALGACLARDDGPCAQRLVRATEAELPLWLRLASRRRRADAACRRLLDPARVARDLEREDVLCVDGWLLARSEAAAAAYLHALWSGTDTRA